MDIASEKELRHCMKSAILKGRMQWSAALKAIEALQNVKVSAKTKGKLLAKAHENVVKMGAIFSAIDEIIEAEICKNNIKEDK